MNRLAPESDLHGDPPTTDEAFVPKPTRRPDEGKQRLVVELSPTNAAELQSLTERESLNKTTIVNRALQLYAFLSKVQDDGGEILLKERNASVAQRIRFL